MTYKERYLNENEKPLDYLVDGYSHTSIFRTIAVVGDSLSSGEFESRDENGEPDWHDMFEYSWGQYIGRKNGTKVYNFSRGGMTAKEYYESFADEMDFWNPEKACQAYIFALGVNDVYNKDMEIGEVKDNNGEKKTFIDFYKAIIERYKKIRPDAKFFLVTVPNTNHEEKEKTLGMIDAMYALAEHFDNTYVIDLYKYMPVHDEKFKERFYLYNHLNPSGYILTAQMIDSYIDYIVRHNYKDFKNVGFIGTDVEIH